MSKWLVPTITEVLAFAGAEDAALRQKAPLLDANYSASVLWRQRQALKARSEWLAAKSSLNSLLEHFTPDTATPQGMILSGSGEETPFVGETGFLSLPDRFSVWHFLLNTSEETGANRANSVNLLANDPLSQEQFCLVLTKHFSLAMALGWDASETLQFQFSFDSEVVNRGWEAMRSRLLLTANPQQQGEFQALGSLFSPVIPNYKTVMQFSQLLLQYLPPSVDWEANIPETNSSPYPSQLLLASAKDEPYTVTPLKNKNVSGEIAKTPADAEITLDVYNPSNKVLAKPININANHKSVLNQTPGLDVELIQALAHEVRTPLTTIRTLTRLLLKGATDPKLIQRLESIDRECTEQIDRFSLIFRAAELETAKEKPSPAHLTSTSLAQIFTSCIPRWEKQANRRNISLDVILPQECSSGGGPSVVSDPTMLERVLTGAIDNFTANLTPGSEVKVHVTLAGNQLKILLSGGQSPDLATTRTKLDPTTPPQIKSLGKLLVFQPETGQISLNLSVTKHLFQYIGGKLIVRDRPLEGKVLTIFLPLEA
ncbi:sensor histidine kinase KdpD [[Phormidium] sp. ETS-05]|uniref:sensor histidine kinase n=1 Tax=[Phormidium] sp. ETS-05 TaxID=222819 RepID=UPI0018EEDE83|nr:HAMP domain-containing sensor histidine kinase [[Phormidium] sp. ETS-05]